MTRKNIILITVDDGNAFWRYRDVFGAKLLTPGLDRIFDASAAFTSAYCQTPICGPSRASLLSGLAPHQTGVLDNYTSLFSVLRPEQLWQHRLKRAGYYCSTAGKVHHSFGPMPPHIHDVLYSHPAKRLTLGPPRNVPVRKFGGSTGGAGTTDPAHDRLYYDHQSATDAVAFLQGYDGDAPFYREIGFHHPHLPLKTPELFKLMYDEGAFEQPQDWLRGFDVCDYPDLFMIENMDLRDRDFWRKSVRNYFSAWSHVDSHIARVWEALKASRHADDTVLILTSDHGYHLGDKNRFRKFTLWEESCRVPLIIHDPGAAPARIDDPVALLDVGPTVLDYADCPPLRGAPGVSLRGAVHGARDPDRAAPTFLYGNASMRKGRFRITRYQDGSSEFHDVEQDMWLTRNLAGKAPEYPQMRRELTDICARHGLHIHDPGAPPAQGACNFTLGAARGGRGAIETGPTPAGIGLKRARVHFTTLDGDGDAVLPQGFVRMHYGADTGGRVKHFRAFGNREDNEFLFPGSFNRFRLEVLTGPGNNRVHAQMDDLIVHAGPGETEISTGGGNCVFHGGSGRTVMRAGRGHCLLHGGPGDAVMTGGAGETVFTCGAGRNTITCGPGRNHITVDGGINRIRAAPGVVLVFHRTGLPQEVTGFASGTVDLSDWAAMGPVRIGAEGPHCRLTCGTESVLFHKTGPDLLRGAVTGADLAAGPEDETP